MGTSNQPATQPQQGQVIAPQVLPAVPASISQFTAIAAYVPQHVWTEDALKHFHEQQKEVLLDNNKLLDKLRDREHSMAIIVLSGFAAILAVGFTFAYLKIDLGRDIVISAVSAGLGYAAGYGTGLTKKP